MNDAVSRCEQLIAHAKSNIQEIEVMAVKQNINTDQPIKIIDIREDSEWQNGHLPTAIHLNRGLLELKIETIIPDVHTPIILYCAGGGRSALAALSLQTMGYTHVQSMAGGFKAWTKATVP